MFGMDLYDRRQKDNNKGDYIPLYLIYSSKGILLMEHGLFLRIKISQDLQLLLSPHEGGNKKKNSCVAKCLEILPDLLYFSTVHHLSLAQKRVQCKVRVKCRPCL